MDKIIVKGLKLYAYHGVNPPEKANGQLFILDIISGVDLEVPCRSDNVNDTVSYAKIIKLVRKIFLADKYDLIERAAEAVADAVLNEFPPIKEVEVLLKKPQAPIKADFDYVAVQINRSRQ